MNFVTESLRRHAVTISLMFAAGPRRGLLRPGVLARAVKNTCERYFRVMGRIGENLQNKSQAYAKRVDAMRREIQHGVC